VSSRSPSSRSRYIAVDGPIGAGKKALARVLAEELGSRLVEERPEENPFLGGFYRDPQRHGLSVQLFFLMQRYQQQADLVQEDLFAQGGVVSNYLFGKDRLFATLTLSPPQLALYDRFYNALEPRAVVPDLVVYVQARTEVLFDRVQRRARQEERPLRFDYLKSVAAAYADFFFRYTEAPLLIVNSSELDLENNADDRAALVDVVRRTHAGINHWSRT
jgi:deoxyguanosine kinase